MTGIMGAQEFAESLASELLELKVPTVVILDDFHHLTDVNVIGFVNELGRLSVPNLHIIAASQKPVPIQTAALRAKGHLYEIDQADLTFTTSEADTFLSRVIPAEIPAPVIHDLVKVSEGWITAIHLAAITSVQTGITLAEISRGSASMDSMLEFIRKEVLDRQAKETQAWLFRLAIPERFNQSLAEALASNYSHSELGEEPLETLLASGLVSVAHSEDGKWYRFHSLLREALISHLRTEVDDVEIADLHRLAFDWFEARGDIDAALYNVLNAGDQKAAASLIARHTQQALIEDRWLQLDRWISALPWEVKKHDYELLAGSAWIQQIRGRHDLMRELTASARHLVGAEESTHHTSLHQIRVAELDLLDAMDHSNNRHPGEQRSILESCLETLTNSGRFAELAAFLWVPSFLARSDAGQIAGTVRRMISLDAIESTKTGPHRAVWARNGLILARLSVGDYQLAEDKAVISINDSKRLGLDRMLAMSQLMLAIVRSETNKLHDAEDLARSAYTNPSAGVLVFTLAGCLLAKVLNAQGKQQEADAALGQLLESLLQSERTEFLPEVSTSFAHMNLARGDREAAVAYLRHVEINVRAPQAFSIEPRAFVYAIAHLVDANDSERERALSILHELAANPLLTHWKSLDLKVDLGLALTEFQSGDVDVSFARLSNVIARAESRGFFRMFLEVHPTIIELLQAYRQTVVHSPYLDSILSAADTPSVKPPPSGQKARPVTLVSTYDDTLIEPLSEREQEVLLGLQDRLSNKEIASELSISALTVKSHTRSIYGKLGVNSRRQAVARAMELGILQD